MRDLLWRCDEHRGPDADFPALRGLRGAAVRPPLLHQHRVRVVPEIRALRGITPKPGGCS
jgi:hypothetical protein